MLFPHYGDLFNNTTVVIKFKNASIRAKHLKIRQKLPTNEALATESSKKRAKLLKLVFLFGANVIFRNSILFWLKPRIKNVGSLGRHSQLIFRITLLFFELQGKKLAHTAWVKNAQRFSLYYKEIVTILHYKHLINHIQKVSSYLLEIIKISIVWDKN